MPKSYFDFKQFRIYHDRCAMKVGTDGVLLGAWSSTEGVNRALDIGTGSGLVALMIAQRGVKEVVGVEIDTDAAQQAAENAAASPWSNNIQIESTDISDFKTEKKFDLIVSNPPYFEEALRCPDNRRSAARHADTSLNFAMLTTHARRLIKEGGRFCVIIPTTAESSFMAACIAAHFTLVHRTAVITRSGKAPRRLLLELCQTTQALTVTHDELILQDDNENPRSEAYTKLTSDFYL